MDKESSDSGQNLLTGIRDHWIRYTFTQKELEQINNRNGAKLEIRVSYPTAREGAMTEGKMLQVHPHLIFPQEICPHCGQLKENQRG